MKIIRHIHDILFMFTNKSVDFHWKLIQQKFKIPK